MKRILIPTDFTPDSLDNIRNILHSLKDTKNMTEILLLNTYIVQQTDPSLVIGLNDKKKLESKFNLEKLRLELLQDASNAFITVSTASHLGSLKNVIMQFLQKENFEQLAITKGQEIELRSIRDMLKSKSCLLTVHNT